MRSASFHEALLCFSILIRAEQGGSCVALTSRPVVSYPWSLMGPSHKFTIPSRAGPRRGMRHAAVRGLPPIKQNMALRSCLHRRRQCNPALRSKADVPLGIGQAGPGKNDEEWQGMVRRPCICEARFEPNYSAVQPAREGIDQPSSEVASPRQPPKTVISIRRLSDCARLFQHPLPVSQIIRPLPRDLSPVEHSPQFCSLYLASDRRSLPSQTLPTCSARACL